MRTTVSIPDELLASARRRARERGTTLGQVVEAALRRELAAAETRAAPPLPVFTRGTGPLAGVEMTSNRALLEALDEGQHLDRQR